LFIDTSTPQIFIDELPKRGKDRPGLIVSIGATAPRMGTDLSNQPAAKIAQ
jgi:hypothetical protein